MIKFVFRSNPIVKYNRISIHGTVFNKLFEAFEIFVLHVFSLFETHVHFVKAQVRTLFGVVK